MARIANAKIDPDQLMREGATSGLVRYLFGDDLSGSLTKEHFVKLQSDLIDDVLEMEFTRYVDSTAENISETDFCRHLLYSSSISQKRKEKMIKLVEAEFKGKSDGISFESFKTFYNVLFGGADLERAMFFLDSENQGVTRDEFGKVANWVVGTKVDPHVIEVFSKKIHAHKNTNTAPGGLLPAGRGRGPQPEHEGVQPGSLLMAALKRIPKRGPKRDPWKYEVLGFGCSSAPVLLNAFATYKHHKTEPSNRHSRKD